MNPQNSLCLVQSFVEHHSTQPTGLHGSVADFKWECSAMIPMRWRRPPLAPPWQGGGFFCNRVCQINAGTKALWRCYHCRKRTSSHGCRCFIVKIAADTMNCVNYRSCWNWLRRSKIGIFDLLILRRFWTLSKLHDGA